MACVFFNPWVFTYAYVTYQDIKQVGNLKDQTVIVVKAPTETKLEVPDPDEVCEHILVGRGNGSALFVCDGRIQSRVGSRSLQWTRGFLLIQKSFLPCGKAFVISRQQESTTRRALSATLSTLNSGNYNFIQQLPLNCWTNYCSSSSSSQAHECSFPPFLHFLFLMADGSSGLIAKKKDMPNVADDGFVSIALR